MLSMSMLVFRYVCGLSRVGIFCLLRHKRSRLRLNHCCVVESETHQKPLSGRPAKRCHRGGGT